MNNADPEELLHRLACLIELWMVHLRLLWMKNYGCTWEKLWKLLHESFLKYYTKYSMLRVVVYKTANDDKGHYIFGWTKSYKSCYKPKQTSFHFNKKNLFILTHIQLGPPLLSPCRYIQVLCNKTKNIGNIINLKKKVNWYARWRSIPTQA